MIRFLATTISVIFHPIWMPILMFCTFKFMCEDFRIVGNYHPGFLLQLAIFSVLGPLLSLLGIIIINKKPLWKTLLMEKQEDREIPFFFLIIYYGMTIYQLIGSRAHDLFIHAMIGALISLIILLLINRKSKISAHMIGISGMIGAVSGLFSVYQLISFEWIFLLLIIAGIIASARLYLKAHLPYQIYVGALIGFTVEYVMVSKELFPIHLLYH